MARAEARRAVRPRLVRCSTADSSACATAIRDAADVASASRSIVPVAPCWCLPLGPPCSSLSVATSSPHRRRPDPAPRSRARGHPDREYGSIFQAVEDKIREVIPEQDRALIVDNIGLPARAYNLAFTDGSTIGVNDGTILVALKDGHKPTADYVRKLRQVLPAAFPEDTFYFQAADIVTQILNFGLPAQIDVRTVGYGANNLTVAKELRKRLAASPVSSTRICSRKSMLRRSMPTSTARGPPSSGSTRARSRPISMSASVRRLRSRRISGPIRRRASRIIWPCRHRNTGSIR